MTYHQLNHFCLADGESTPFPIEIEPTGTIGDLKKVIKTEIPVQTPLPVGPCWQFHSTLRRISSYHAALCIGRHPQG